MMRMPGLTVVAFVVSAVFVQLGARAEDKPAAPAAAAVAASKARVCKSGQEERSLEIQAVGQGGCKVMYTRDGKPKEIGGAAHQTDVCDRIQEKVIKKLEGAGYHCA